MTALHHHIATILYQRLKGHAVSPEDEQVLAAWLDKAPENRAIAADLQDEAALRDYLAVLLDTERPKVAFQRFERETLQAGTTTEHLAVVHRVHFLKTAWFRYAAILLLIAGTATFLYLNYPPQKEIAKVQPPLQQPDIQPGGNRALLTLSDGSTIVLDSAANGALANQGGTKIIKLDAGSLAYNNASANGEIGMNTISTPKGGQYQVVLPDGSKIWLNAASSITFPTSFAGKERRVEVTGEVYFEVKKDKTMPFFVKTTSSAEIEVLGTSFNIKAYSDEPMMNATLLEGSVRINAYSHGQILTPGQQAQVGEQQIKLVNNTDLNKVMAWKNGLFNFEDASLEEVMRQIARWYNIEVVYQKSIPKIYFAGEMSRDVSLSGLIKGLEGAGVNFRIEEGRRLIVYP